MGIEGVAARAWRLCSWDYLPAIYRDGEAWAFFEGRWLQVSGSDVGMSAHVLTPWWYLAKYCPLPPLPAEAFGGAELPVDITGRRVFGGRGRLPAVFGVPSPQ